jgi:aspartyl-tRNA synthetase
MRIKDLSERFAETGFNAFEAVLSDGGSVRGINAGPLGLARSGFDALTDQAKQSGAKGLVWMVVEDDGLIRSPVSKFLSDAELAGIVEDVSASPGDTILIVADTTSVVLEVLGNLRLHVGRPDGHDELAFAFVVDFPVFDVGEDGTLSPAHHPFTAPASLDDMVHTPQTAVSKAYDLVLNGSELGSGSVRIHDPEMQAKVFEVMGISQEEAAQRFGWFLEALRYGTPPHAGFAIGIDRFVSILRGEPNIREIIPFPKTQTGADPLTGSPNRVEDEQLDELGILVNPSVVASWSVAEETPES